MVDRRHLLFGSFATVLAPHATAVSTLQETADIDQLGKFQLVLGRPGIVVGVPHATPDTGTMDVGRVFCERLGAGGVFVTGFWDSKTRQRVNVNRPTEQIIGQDSEVVRQWPSDRAVAANARYTDMVKEAAQGQLKVFYEIHSNHRPRYAGSIEVSTLGFSRGDADRLKAAFEAARDRFAPDIPRLAIHVFPLDKVTYPNYGVASSISKLSERGCAIESPGHVLENRSWRLAYATCLADAIKTAQWGGSP
jgi:hypothetical protein